MADGALRSAGGRPNMLVRYPKALDRLGLVGWPKTSGKRGLHAYVRIEPRWSFGEVRSASPRARRG